MDDVIALGTDGKHASLGANVAQIGAIKVIGQLDDGLQVQGALHLQGGGMDLEDVETRLVIGQGNFDLAIQATRPHQGRVQDVWSIGGHDDLDAPKDIKAVHLIEQLHQRALDLAIRRRALREASSADGVDLVHKDDARLVLLGILEHFADDARRLADVLVHDGGRDDLDKIDVQRGRHGTRQQRLARARRAVQQHALGRTDADALEQLGLQQRQLDDLAKLAHLAAQSADAVEAHVARLFERHVEHLRPVSQKHLVASLHVAYRGIDFAWQDAHNCKGRHVQGDACAVLQSGSRNAGPRTHNVSRAAAGLDDD